MTWCGYTLLWCTNQCMDNTKEVYTRYTTCTSFLFSMHSLVQRRRVYPHHVVRWSSRDCNSPTQPHPFLLLLHLILSALISRSPVHGESMSGRYCPAHSYMASLKCFCCERVYIIHDVTTDCYYEQHHVQSVTIVFVF